MSLFGAELLNTSIYHLSYVIKMLTLYCIFNDLIAPIVKFLQQMSHIIRQLLQGRKIIELYQDICQDFEAGTCELDRIVTQMRKHTCFENFGVWTRGLVLGIGALGRLHRGDCLSSHCKLANESLNHQLLSTSTQRFRSSSGLCILLRSVCWVVLLALLNFTLAVFLFIDLLQHLRF